MRNTVAILRIEFTNAQLRKLFHLVEFMGCPAEPVKLSAVSVTLRSHGTKNRRPSISNKTPRKM